jgi:hypothetical protein
MSGKLTLHGAPGFGSVAVEAAPTLLADGWEG